MGLSPPQFVPPQEHTQHMPQHTPQHNPQHNPQLAPQQRPVHRKRPSAVHAVGRWLPRARSGAFARREGGPRRVHPMPPRLRSLPPSNVSATVCESSLGFS